MSQGLPRILLLVVLIISIFATPHFDAKTLEIDKTTNNLNHRNLQPQFSLKEDTHNTTTNFSFIQLRDYLKNKLLTKYGGFPLGERGDEYINATYFGTKALYAIGGWTLDVERKFKENFSEYIFDEQNNGFREWFGSNTTLMATLWGLLLMNFTGIKPSGFDLNSTTKFIENILNNTNEELTCVEASLLLKISTIYNLSFNTSSKIIDSNYLADYILQFYSDGLFSDHINNPIFTTFLALDALISYNRSLISPQLAENIIDRILDFKKIVNIPEDSNESMPAIGFGVKDPTVFETGLSIDIITSLDAINNDERTLNESLITDILTFINMSQRNDGAVARNPKSDVVDIFQAYGAVLAFISLDKLDEFKATSTITPSEQIAIDDTRIINVSFKINAFDTLLSYLSGNATVINMLTGDSCSIANVSYDHESKTYTFSLRDLEPKHFGNYILKARFTKDFGIHNIKINASAQFRIGYEITVDINGTAFKPNQQINVSIQIKFHNGTFVNNSSIIIILTRVFNNTNLVNNTISLNGSTIEYILEIPSRIELGLYRLVLIANDSFGFNHTFYSINLGITDEISYTISGNKTEYYPGEQLNVTIDNITYSYTGTAISTNSNITIKILDDSGSLYWKFKATYNSTKNVSIILNQPLPALIPNTTNLTTLLEITWDNSTYGNKTFDLFNFTIKFNKFHIENISIVDNETFVPINSTDIYIGETYNISINITHTAPNATKTILLNSTIRVHFVYNNTTFSTTQMNYSAYSKTYFGSIYINPNLPHGYNNLTISVFLAFNDTWLNLSSLIHIKGQPLIVDFNAPNEAIANTEYIATFSLVCNYTNKSLPNVSLIAYIKSATPFNAPIIYENNTYYLSFIAPAEKQINITIARTTDNLTLRSIIIHIKTVQRNIWESIDPWVLAIILPIVAYAGYLYIRRIYSSKISRRYLIEKSKKL